MGDSWDVISTSHQIQVLVWCAIALFATMGILSSLFGVRYRNTVMPSESNRTERDRQRDVLGIDQISDRK